MAAQNTQEAQAEQEDAPTHLVDGDDVHSLELCG